MIHNLLLENASSIRYSPLHFGRLRILQILTYYRPWVSGLTIYVERLARALAHDGHAVTILTSAYDPALPRTEIIDGVMIVRAPVTLRVSKGVIMPSFGFMARWLMAGHDLVHMHLPQFDGAGLALNARAKRKPSLLTYHCDISLPAGIVNRVVQPIIDSANHIAARNVDKIVAYTEDYAKHSRLLSKYLHKVKVIPPPVEMEVPHPAQLADFRQKFAISQSPIIGMAARMATEKGVEVLVDAMEIVRTQFPNARVLFAGPHQKVLGEEAYARKLQPRFDALEPQQWSFLGSLKGPELAAFFSACDVTVLPSLNSTESFGLVQVESMLCGTPSICSNLPGVRVSPTITGMGKVTPIGDARALAEALCNVIEHRAAYIKPRAEIEKRFSTARSMRDYVALYQQLIAARQSK